MQKTIDSWHDSLLEIDKTWERKYKRYECIAY